MPAEEDERNNVRVYCRVRPLSERETAGGQQRQCLGADCARGLVALQCKPEPRVFAFDAVASEATSQVSLCAASAHRCDKWLSAARAAGGGV